MIQDATTNILFYQQGFVVRLCLMYLSLIYGFIYQNKCCFDDPVWYAYSENWHPCFIDTSGFFFLLFYIFNILLIAEYTVFLHGNNKQATF